LLNTKEKELKMIHKEPQSIDSDMSKHNQHYLKQYKNSEELNIDLKINSKRPQLMNSYLANTINLEKISQVIKWNTKNFYFILERNHNKED
jgi:hypothetical protein